MHGLPCLRTARQHCRAAAAARPSLLWLGAALRACCSPPLLAKPSAAAAVGKAMSPIIVGPSEIGTGAVFPEQYEEQLADKVARVKELFSSLKLPEIEVFKSNPQHFRSRAEFRVWQQGEDLFYIMYEQPSAQDTAAAAAAAGEQVQSPQAVDTEMQQEQQQEQQLEQESTASHTEAAAPDAAAAAEGDKAAAPAVAPAQYKKGRKRGGKRRSAKAAAAAAAGAGDAAGLAAAGADGQQQQQQQASRRYPKRVRIDEFPVADELICAIMPLLRKELAASSVLRDRLFQANFHSSLSRQAVVTLAYHKALDDVWQAAAGEVRARLAKALGPEVCSALHIIGRSRKQKVVLGADHVIERMLVDGRTFEYMQVEGAFAQPNAGVCQQMLNWAVDVTRGSTGDLLELYCGNGNFTLPLAQNFKQVVATEVSKASVAAARHNIAANGADNILMARMSSEEFTETWKVKGKRNRLAGLNWAAVSLETLFVDPPRAGLDAATVQLLQDFRQVVYISCNPETLADNLKSVSHSHDIKRFAVFDQFPYTQHLECGAFLVKKHDPAIA